MNLINELTKKSNQVENTELEVINEIEKYFNKYFDSKNFEEDLRKCISQKDIANRKKGITISFWEYHSGCSTTNFRCFTKVWYNPECKDGWGSHVYKSISLESVSELICLYLKDRLIEKMLELGFRYITTEDCSGNLNYYDKCFYFGW